jgi:hypothetical protein
VKRYVGREEYDAGKEKRNSERNKVRVKRTAVIKVRTGY